MNVIELRTKADDFLKKYDNQEIRLKKEANDFSIYVGTHRKSIPDALAETILKYRKANKYASSTEQYNEYKYFKDALDDFLQVIENADAHNLIENQQTSKELRETKEKCSQLEKELENLQSIIEELKEQKISLKTQLEMCVNRYATLKSFLGMESNIEVSELEEKE